MSNGRDRASRERLPWTSGKCMFSLKVVGRRYHQVHRLEQFGREKMARAKMPPASISKVSQVA